MIQEPMHSSSIRGRTVPELLELSKSDRFKALSAVSQLQVGSRFGGVDAETVRLRVTKG